MIFDLENDLSFPTKNTVLEKMGSLTGWGTVDIYDDKWMNHGSDET